ncbi:hypothetical protein LTR08_004124 [Meristemomyces frigidus]|nr:hypothetical protein LTR08_004124 [Meristemomyces frigidus]
MPSIRFTSSALALAFATRTAAQATLDCSGTNPTLTFTSTTTVPNVVATNTVQATASCKLPSNRRQYPDPVASVLPSVLGGLVDSIFGDLGITLKARNALPAPTARSASTEFKRALIERRAISPAVKADYVLERRERLALNKRAPDEPTVTTTQTTAVSTLVQTTSTAPATTIFASVVQTSTYFTTPLTTVTKGIAIGIAYSTASQQTITRTTQVPGTKVVITQTSDVTLTVTSETTPAAVAASCSSDGGVLV